MTNNSSYQPFLIGQGNYQTGLFTLLQSWVKPEDAFDLLQNAYVYRGSIYQRNGMIPYQSTPGDGGLVYLDSLHIDSGDGGNSYGYTFLKLPIVPGTVKVWALTNSGDVESMTDDGVGGFTGSLDAGTSAIDYITGILTIDTNDVIDAAVAIWAQFGYVPTQITTGTNSYNPIMGIKQFYNPSDGIPITIVFDTKRASYYNRSNTSFTGLNQFSQVIWEQVVGGTAITTGSKTTQWTNLSPYSVTVTDTTGNEMVDDGTGGFKNVTSSATPFEASSSLVTYATGVLTVNYPIAGNPPVGTQITITANVTGDYFTGDNTNFFNSTNWNFNDLWGPYLFATNNIDPITLFNGTQLSRPLFNTTQSSVLNFSYTNNDTIETCLDLEVYQNRLLLIRPKLLNASMSEPQTIRYSIEPLPAVAISIKMSPFNFAADVPGNGGFNNVPTGDWFMTAELLRDVLILFFQRSTWLMRFTGNDADPFRFSQINSTRQTDAPYGSVVYDIHATSMGALGLIYCDGVGVDRYDIDIIDQIEQINQQGFAQCFAENHFASNQTWLLYPTADNELLTSDAAFIFNILEKTWAIYKFDLGELEATPGDINALSCLGLGLNTQDLAWEDFAADGFFGANGLTWAQANFSWTSYLTQTLAPMLLGGDQNGTVYLMNASTTDNGNPIETIVRTKRLNPFIADSMKASFGYLDIYYVASREMTISVNIYLNNSDDVSKTTTLKLVADDNASYSWKRIYLNSTGEFVQIEITNEVPYGSGEFDDDGVFQILGMILHAHPAGRLTPGTFI